MNDLSNELANQIYLLREKKENLALEDLRGILEKVAGALNTKNSEVEGFLRDEIVKIANHIEQAKNEIIALSPEAENGKDANTATIQLDAVLKSTEEAAHNIMDAAEEIQNIVSSIEANEDAKRKIEDEITKIYEACNFQDITGQRIKKVMQALEFTETKIKKLISMFSSDGVVITEKLKEMKDERSDSHLMNGPQLSSEAPSQSDIDAMFG